MNLLTDPVFRTQTPDGLACLSLPQLLEALGGDRVESLLGLQRHQEDAFHVFLCYLAGAVLARENQTDPHQTADFWLTGIRRLTGREDDCAWSLVIEDVTQPAFMQAPVPKPGDFADFKPKAATPDALDVLPTAKNHDIKSSKAGRPLPENWVYALISLQTMSGFFGQGNYGIARMNGGFGSRAVVSLAHSQRPGRRWHRDTARLQAVRGELLAGDWKYQAQGHVLLWILPWDLKSSLSLAALDPLYIEIARAVRLLPAAGGIQALGASTKAPRIAAGETGGVLGDPWTPINLNDKKKGQSALTVSASGLSPELLRNLLFKDGYKPAEMQQADAEADSPDCRFTATVLVRGQGTTDGFHHASLPIPPGKARRSIRRGSDERKRLAELSKTALNDAKEMQNRVLKPAVIALLEGGPEKINFDRREVNQWLTDTAKQYSETWAADFFPWLWRQAEQEDKDAARLEWLQALRDKAKAVLEDAIARYPAREGRRYRSRVKAEGLFYGTLFKTFEQLKETTHDAKHSA
ncbi:type I-E CRISPR-associated protein Cse1/CasA [Methylogaea oryzae]|uniref:CRISPR-associated protein Cse1 n=3 Tax=Methylogaea oryzae TaxID=1295382 RepID=A0A8D4VPG6_9GAMM|nr:type I-E CRISPR-associated protein Cse1/CasA [Methylogaea oryzae]BBL71645.1 CRISPR-associated protein Cse1 [Methylogaea oryzae]